MLNEVYTLVENLETALLCSLQCGEDPSEILVKIKYLSISRKKSNIINIKKKNLSNNLSQ